MNKNHLLGLVALLLVVILAFSACGDKANNSILEVDGQAVTVYNTEAEARAAEPYRFATGGIYKMTVPDDVQVKGFLNKLVIKENGKHGSKHDYTVDLSKGYVDFVTGLMQVSFVLELTKGEPNSYVEKQFFGEGDIERYYLLVEISDGSSPSDVPSDTPSDIPSNAPSSVSDTPSSDESTSTATSGTTDPSTTTTTVLPEILPSGEVYFGADEINFNTYESREAAAEAARVGYTPNLSAKSVEGGLLVKGAPTDGTMRIRVKVHMVDDDVFDDNSEVVLHADNGWSGVLNIDAYRGHRVTLMLKAEGSWGLKNSYSYVTVSIPD